MLVYIFVTTIGATLLAKITSLYITNQNLIYNNFHNILRLFDVLPNFPLTASEMMYYS